MKRRSTCLRGSTIWQSRKNDLVWIVYKKDFLEPCPSSRHSLKMCVCVSPQLSMSVSMSTLCRTCVEVGVTPHTTHFVCLFVCWGFTPQIGSFFFFESYPFSPSQGVSVCLPVYWEPATLKLLSFFLSWVSKTQTNHWTKRMANTPLAT